MADALYSAALAATAVPLWLTVLAFNDLPHIPGVGEAKRTFTPCWFEYFKYGKDWLSDWKNRRLFYMHKASLLQQWTNSLAGRSWDGLHCATFF